MNNVKLNTALYQKSVSRTNIASGSFSVRQRKFFLMLMSMLCARIF